MRDGIGADKPIHTGRAQRGFRIAHQQRMRHGDIDTAWSASSGVSNCAFVPSMPTR